MVNARTLIGGTPAPAVRPVSLAVKHYLGKFDPSLVVVGVSGGADSLALATALLGLAHRPEVWTVTVDHGLRPGSGAEASRVADHLKDLGADQALTASVTVTGGAEGAARDARFMSLEKIVGDRDADILLGHTMDDQAETVLLRLGRGASSRGLAAMAHRRPHPVEGAGRVWIGRPLLDVRRADTVAFCESLGLPVVDDPTNYMDGPWQGADGAPLRRASVRELALPALSQALSQDVVPALARIALQAQEDEEVLSSLVPESSAALAATAPALRKRALHRMAVEAGAPAGAVTHVHVERMDALITAWKGQGPVDLPGGVRAWREQGRLLVQKV